MQIFKSQSGFIGGAYIATLVASVAMLGTLITLTAGLAQKVGTTQSDLNTKKNIDRLAEYILANKISNIDGDRYLELPRMYYTKTQPNPEGDTQQWEQSAMGFIEPLLTTINNQEVDLRDTIGKDAYGRDFRICSINLQDIVPPYVANGRREVQANTTLLMKQSVFAIISYGQNGTPEYTCNYALNETPVNGSDDQIRLIKYGEVLEHANANRRALLHNGVPTCTALQTLEYTNVQDGDGNATGEHSWNCRDNYMNFVNQDYSSHGLRRCLDSQRLALNADGTLGCRVVDQLANQVPENINMGRLAAGICYRGYAIGALSSVANDNYSFRCDRLSSYGDEIGPPSVSLSIPLLASSCDFQASGGQFKALYQSRDGTLRCLGMPSSLLSGSNCSGRPYIVFDRGKLFCFAGNLSFEVKQTCQPNQILEFQTVTNNTQCLESNNTQEPRNWIIPYSDTRTSCRAGDFIMHDGTNYVCLDRFELLTRVTPSSSCNGHQMVSWDETNKKFKCIYR
ncbi:MAG: hypothetical protein EYC62_07995 [Alphaproteobacteria bacterium]|nr:MAG: hypothetical protein EYC62_07995 [Alphaproteobacteria bacterium]